MFNILKYYVLIIWKKEEKLCLFTPNAHNLFMSNELSNAKHTHLKILYIH